MTLSVITAVSRAGFCGGAGLLDWLTLPGSSGLAPAQCLHFSLRRGFEPKSQRVAFLRVHLAVFVSPSPLRALLCLSLSSTGILHKPSSCLGRAGGTNPSASTARAGLPIPFLPSPSHCGFPALLPKPLPALGHGPPQAELPQAEAKQTLKAFCSLAVWGRL